MTVSRGEAMRWVLCVLLATMGCGGCQDKVTQVEPAKLSLEATRLDFPATYVGLTTTLALQVLNSGKASAEVDFVTAAPFSTGPATLLVAGGTTENVSVTFAPTSPGVVTGTLTVGELAVELRGEGLALPECASANPCETSAFELTAAACVVQSRADGESCSSSCLVSGQCQAGTCVGQAKDCGDHNACTADACAEGACLHQPVTCPAPAGPCKVLRCDPSTGCGEEPATDGTLCGPDICTATRVDICINGQCVDRPRPDSGRCANTWVPTYIPAREGHAMAWDAARQRVILFGGVSLSDTWEWDGTTWLQRTPVTSPSARHHHALAYDAARQRVVLFGGYSSGIYLSDTWEWDGTTWLPRTSATPPPGRAEHALAYDAARQRVVLFGGRAIGGSLADTWEWDGTTWLRQTPAVAPSALSSHALAYDAARLRVVLFGGQNRFGDPLSDTWEWDGTTWLKRSPVTSPQARIMGALAYDAARQRVVLFGGQDAFGTLLSDTWEWDGTTWQRQTPAVAPPALRAPLAWDAVRQRVVLFGDSATWEWDGATWRQRSAVTSPSPRKYHALAYDTARQRIVLFGGRDAVDRPLSDTWEWDGTTWLQRNPATFPPARELHALAYDASRQRVVLFGGRDGPGGSLRSDTWEWDGTTWLQRAPVTSPQPRFAHALAYDTGRQRIVLVGGSDGLSLSDTWEWDGTTWLQAPVTSPLPRLGHALSYDTARQRIVLFGGFDQTAPGTPYLSDTWEWDGTTWLTRSPVTSPLPRSAHTLAYDTARQRIVLFGGYAGDSNWLSDTWDWDGANWLQRAPATSPPPRASHALAYDSARQRLVLFGGNNRASVFSDTWLFLP